MSGGEGVAGLSLVNWNVEWRERGSAAGRILRDRIQACDPDIVCLTEAPADFFCGIGHTIECDPDHGYPIRGNRRKIMLWSRRPWSHVDPIGHADVPSGRFVRGRTASSQGEVDVIGVCIPWAAAHVSTGRKDRKRWEDHLSYLEGLTAIVRNAGPRTILVGDFNQALPRRTAPAPVHAALDRCLAGMVVATQGPIPPLDLPAIDHVAHGSGLRAISVSGLSATGPGGERLSDHFGLHVRLGVGAET